MARCLPFASSQILSKSALSAITRQVLPVSKSKAKNQIGAHSMSRFSLNTPQMHFGGSPAMKKYLPKFLFVFVILAICGLPVFGQVTTAGSIVGTVTDPTGAVVPNATVTSKNKSTGKESTATTTDSGNFNIPQVSAGVYTLTVQATSGFKKSQVTDVKVDAGTPTTVNVVLELGNPQETVTVVGGGELIQTQT